MSRPFPSRFSPSAGSFVRINGKIRAREVRVIGPDGAQVGVIPLHEAITMARTRGMDLVEVAPNATPPVCRVVDYGKYRYEQAKKEKESKKHQHANRVKEIQLTATIDAHDFSVKLGHATDFLCEDMRVKVSLRFRGREMAHQEFGVQVMERFIKELAPYGQPIETPKLVGRGLNAMITPLPRNKRAKNPNATEVSADRPATGRDEDDAPDEPETEAETGETSPAEHQPEAGSTAEFPNNPSARSGEQAAEQPGA